MVNKVMILGHVGKNADMHTFENGNKVATITVATNESYKDKNGEKVTNTEWHTVKFFGKLAEIVEKYVKKGDLIFVEGKIKTSSYEKNGNKNYFTEIIASELRMLGGKSEQVQKKVNISRLITKTKQQTICIFKMKTIKVKTCQECPFANSDTEYGLNYCNIANVGLSIFEELPKNGIHPLCPLKKISVKVKLKK